MRKCVILSSNGQNSELVIQRCEVVQFYGNLSGPENDYRIHNWSANDTSPASPLFKMLVLAFSHTLIFTSLCPRARVNIHIYLYTHIFTCACFHRASTLSIVRYDLLFDYRIRLLSNPVKIERRYCCSTRKQICVDCYFPSILLPYFHCQTHVLYFKFSLLM